MTKLSKLTWIFLIASAIFIGAAVGYNSLDKVIPVAVIAFLCFLYLAHEDYKYNEEKKK